MANVTIAGGIKIRECVTIDAGVCICSYVKMSDFSKISTGAVVAYDVNAKSANDLKFCCLS